MQEKIAEPTIGRVVYVYNRHSGTPSVPNVAFVAEVNIRGNPLAINCACLQHSGDFVPGGLRDVQHASDPSNSRFYWDWMPYQKGQASKTEQLQQELDKKVKEAQHRAGPADGNR